MRTVLLFLVVAFLMPCDTRLTDHFINWLNENNYGSYNFQRDDIGGRSVGGKVDDQDTIVNQPVILVHGLTGECYDFNDTIDYFKSYGDYKISEIYATTWGTPTHGYNASSVYLSQEFLLHVRRFMDAVLNYTGAPKVDVIGHSMGVLMSRIAIKGGQQWDNGTYEVGPNLTPKVDTYIGIAGPNLGVNSCYNMNDPLCNDKNGMYPGFMTGTEVVNRSEVLENLNANPGFEGDFVYSIYSTYDEVIGNGGMVYCEYTCHIPGNDLDIRFEDPAYKHISSLYLTAPLQMRLAQEHKVVKEYKKWVIQLNE